MADALNSVLEKDLNELKEKGLYRKLFELSGPQGARAVFNGKEVINLSSNNYLGLNTHPKMIEAAVEATRKFGVGSGAVRTIAGTMSLHEELERRLAVFKHTEAALVLQSGFTANMGVINTVVTDADVIISDELNHASIIDGVRLSKAARRVFAHRNMNSLEDVLKQCQGYRLKLIITDGVFSMDGDIAPLPQIVELAEKYGAITMVDDAHSSGVLGRNGRGSVDHFSLNGRVQIQVGTLSKALGALGGYVAGSQLLREAMIHKARPFLFSTSHPPGVTASLIAAVDILESEPELMETLWRNARYLKKGLQELGFNTGVSETPITPVIVGKGSLAMKLSDLLFANGVFAQGIGYPTVPEEKSRVRTIVSAQHSIADLDEALDAFRRVGTQLGII